MAMSKNRVFASSASLSQTDWSSTSMRRREPSISGATVRTQLPSTPFATSTEIREGWLKLIRNPSQDEKIPQEVGEHEQP